MIYLHIIVQSILAIILGGILGVERSIWGRFSGWYVNALLCFVAMIFSLVIGVIEGGAVQIASAMLISLAIIGGAILMKTDLMADGIILMLNLFLTAMLGYLIGTSYFLLSLEMFLIVLVLFMILDMVRKYGGKYESRHYMLDIEINKISSLEYIENLIKKCGFQIMKKTIMKSGNIHVGLEYLAHPLSHMVFLKKLSKVEDAYLEVNIG